MTWAMEMKIKKADWMEHPEIRWRRGLEKAGLNFRQGLSRSHYPPINPRSRYERTYQTADKANFRIEDMGLSMTFGSTFYLPFILYGTSKWIGWPGKLEFLKRVMKQGFAAGIRDYPD